MKKVISDKEILKGGTLNIDFINQIFNIKLINRKEVKKISVNEGYHLWCLLNCIFDDRIENKKIIKKLKVYNNCGEEINLK